MPVSREVQAAIGGLIIDMTWIECLAARLVRLARLTDNEMSLLAPGGKLIKHARKAAGEFEDSEAAERTRRWLCQAESLRRKRHQVVHSIVLYSHPVGWAAYHPESGNKVEYSTREIVDLAQRVHVHADEGTYMSLFDWPRALGRADSARAEDETE